MFAPAFRGTPGGGGVGHGERAPSSSGGRLKGTFEPLALGRTRRRASAAQWAALVARDRGCIRYGRAPRYCQAHHIHHWKNGGRTDLSNLALSCSRCHHDLHIGRYTITMDTHTIPVITHTRGPPEPDGPSAPMSTGASRNSGDVDTLPEGNVVLDLGRLGFGIRIGPYSVRVGLPIDLIVKYEAVLSKDTCVEWWVSDSPPHAVLGEVVVALDNHRVIAFGDHGVVPGCLDAAPSCLLNPASIRTRGPPLTR